jgi:dUTP pyrophosphatase
MIKFETIEGVDNSYLPSCKTTLSAGLDIKTTEELTINPKETIKVSTGVKIKDCDHSLYLECFLRSSMRFKFGLTQLGVGVIDGDYRGEIIVLIHNTSKYIRSIKKGDRIAQLVVKENLTQKFAGEYCEEGERVGGFGSTNLDNAGTID